MAEYIVAIDVTRVRFPADACCNIGGEREREREREREEIGDRERERERRERR